MGRVRLVAVGIAAPAAISIAVACGAPTIPNDDLPTGLPGRRGAEGGIVDGGGGGADVAPGVDSSPTPTPDAAADAAAAAAKLLCSEPDLALCYAFEGAVVDGSPNAAVPAVVSNVSFVAGKSGSAGSFGANSAVRFGASQIFEVTAATIEAWVKVAPNAAVDGVIMDDDGRASLTILVDGTVLCKPGGSGGKVTADQWTHVACVFDGANVHIYVAGVEVGQGAGSIPSSPASGAAIGGNSPDGEPLVGAIDSFRFFKVARTPAQIAAAAAP